MPKKKPEYLNFTKADLDAITPPETGRRYVYDKKQPGLLIMVTVAGSKSFQVRKSIANTAQRVTLGRFPDMTVAQARAKALQELSQIANTRQSSNQKKAEARKNDTLTVGRALVDYLRSHKNLKPATVNDYKRSMRVGFPDWEHLPLTRITRAMVEARHRERSDISPARANNEMRVLRCLFNYAAGAYFDKDDKPLIASNPVSALSHSRAWNKIDRKKSWIKPDILPAWFAAVDTLPEWYGGEHAHAARPYLLITLLHGYRRSESGNLQWENVDFANRTIQVEDTKNREAHELPLTDYAADLLQQWQAWTGQTSGYVFRATDGISPLHSVEGVVEAISGRIKHPWTMHDLRRTFLTTSENIGNIGDYTLKRLANHKSGASDVTGGYIITDIEALREPMQKITDKLLALASATLPTTKTATAEAIPE